MTDTCQHDIAEMETAVADGMCPICLSRRLREQEQQLQEANQLLTTCENGGDLLKNDLDKAESAERLLQELRHALDVSTFNEQERAKQLAEREMQMAGLVRTLKMIIYGTYDTEGTIRPLTYNMIIREANEALTNLPDVSKYRRLLEAVEKWERGKFYSVDDAAMAGLNIDLLRAFRAIKERT